MKKQDKTEFLKGMIRSCFAYGGAERDSHNFNEWIAPYKAELGEALFNEVYEAHLAYLKANFMVEHNTSTDFEGCTYNSLVKIKP